MKYIEFVEHVSPFAVFGRDVLQGLSWSWSAQDLQLNRWVKTGQLIRLKRGLYTLPPPYRKQSFSGQWLANTLYSPSYLSLEYVLSRHDLIPERVEEFTSVSIHKTAFYTNALGRFGYRHLKDSLFFGFTETPDEHNVACLMATPEKAFLDWVYLRPGVQPTEDYLLKGMRLQQFEQFRKKKLIEYAGRFGSKKIDRMVSVLLRMCKGGT